MEEIPLTGGRSTPGVVRIGDTVRRPAHGRSDRVAELLTHLERAGFDGAPRYRGRDEQGRDILTYLDGESPADLAHFEDDRLAAAASLLRRFHDATVDLAARWQPGAKTVCHNDWGPTNTIFRACMPVAMIDFDTVAPGDRLRDLGSSAFLWLDLGNADYSGEEQRRRLQVFAAGYDRADCPAHTIAARAIERQEALARRGASEGNAALGQWAADAAVWTRRYLRL